MLVLNNGNKSDIIIYDTYLLTMVVNYIRMVGKITCTYITHPIFSVSKSQFWKKKYMLRSDPVSVPSVSKSMFFSLLAYLLRPFVSSQGCLVYRRKTCNGISMACFHFINSRYILGTFWWFTPSFSLIWCKWWGFWCNCIF